MRSVDFVLDIPPPGAVRALRDLHPEAFAAGLTADVLPALHGLADMVRLFVM